MMSTLEITPQGMASGIPDDDAALVQAVREGCVSAFERLVDRHERRMFRVAHGLLHNHEDSQDAVQETFLKAFQRLDQFQGRSKFSTWLTRITLNEALAKLRKKPVVLNSIDDGFHDGEEARALPHDIASCYPDPEMLCTASELNRILERNLRKLKPGLRTVFLLRDLEGLSLKETAQRLGLTIAAVKSRSSRARLQLRDWLACSFQKPQVTQ